MRLWPDPGRNPGRGAPPDPLAGFKGAASWRGGEGEGRKGEGRGGEGKGRRGAGRGEEEGG